MYSSYQVMYTVGYSLSLGALLLALVILLGLRYTAVTQLVPSVVVGVG